MRLGAFTARVVVDGKPLEEYDVVYESPTKATCWVASEEGKLFGVEWRCHEQSRVQAAKGGLYVDGIGCSAGVMRPGTLGTNDTRTLSTLIDGKIERGLVFSRVQLSDDDSLLNKAVSKNLGEIYFSVVRGKMIKVLRRDCSTRSTVLGDNKLHERVKKATVHCVGFGPEVTRQCNTYSWDLYRNNEPELIFTFKYQPLDVLQANGIAPRPTVTPNDASANDEMDRSERRGGTLNDTAFQEDIKPSQLRGRIRDLENELKRLRDLEDTTDSEEQKPKRIKMEEPRERRRAFARGEIIDLT